MTVQQRVAGGAVIPEDGKCTRLGGALGRLGGVLEASRGRLEASWDVLGRLGAFWGVLGASLGRLGSVLGASWEHLGGVLGASWGVLWASWERHAVSWGDLERLGGVLGRPSEQKYEKQKIVKNHKFCSDFGQPHKKRLRSSRRGADAFWNHLSTPAVPQEADKTSPRGRRGAKSSDNRSGRPAGPRWKGVWNPPPSLFPM